MKKLLVNLQYLTTPALVLLNTYGVAKGGQWVWLGVLLLAAAIAVDTAVTVKTTGTGRDKDGNLLGVPAFLLGILYAMYPVFILQQAVLAWRVYAYVILFRKSDVVSRLSLHATFAQVRSGWCLSR